MLTFFVSEVGDFRQQSLLAEKSHLSKATEVIIVIKDYCEQLSEEARLFSGNGTALEAISRPNQFQRDTVEVTNVRTAGTPACLYEPSLPLHSS